MAVVMLSTKAFAGDPTGTGNAATNNGSTTSNVAVTDNIDNSQSILSYHHGSSGGSSAIEGKNVIYAGVGFLSLTGLIASVYTTAGYTVTHIPNISLGYERGLSEHWGVGAVFSYSSLSFTLNDQTGDPFFNNGNPYTYSDKLTLTGISFALTGAYHFHASEKVDPYLGIGLGYQSLSVTWSTTDPNAALDGNAQLSTISGAGLLFQTEFGCRFYFTDNIGAWADFGWHGVLGSLFNIGLTAKF